MGIYNLGGGGGAPELQAKEATPLITNAQQIILPDEGYDGLSKVTVNPMPTGTLKTPTVNSIGYVSSGVQTAGYFDTSATSGLQLSTQAAKTITPTTYSQTAVASGKYTTGAVTVAGDSDLVASNIRNGVNIFGVNGTFVGNYYCKKLSMYLNQNGFSVNLPELSSNISDVLFCVCYSTNGIVVWSSAQIMALMQTYPIEGYAPEVIYDPSRGSVYLMVDGGTQLLNSISGNTITFTLTSTSPGGRTFRTDILYTVLLGVSL